jgi:hypothetical protein
MRKLRHRRDAPDLFCVIDERIEFVLAKELVHVVYFDRDFRRVGHRFSASFAVRGSFRAAFPASLSEK